MYLTAKQCKYLGGLIDASHAEAPWDPGDTVIEDQDGDGWIFVRNASHEDHDDEGAGVWVDTEGCERHAPSGLMTAARARRAEAAG